MSISDALYKWAYQPLKPKAVHLDPYNHTIWIEGKIYHEEQGQLFDLGKEYPGNYSGQKPLLFDNMGRGWMGNGNGLLEVNVTRNRFSQYLHNPSDMSGTSTRGLLVRNEKLYSNNEANGFEVVDINSGQSTTIRQRKGMSDLPHWQMELMGAFGFRKAKTY